MSHGTREWVMSCVKEWAYRDLPRDVRIFGCIYAVSIRRSQSVAPAMCDMTHSYGPWLIDICHVWHDSFIWAMTHWYMPDAPWLIHMCHDSFIYAVSIRSAAPAKCPSGRHPLSTSLLAYTCTHTLGSSTCAMTHLYVPWLIRLYHVQSIRSVTPAKCPLARPYVLWLIYMCHDSCIMYVCTGLCVSNIGESEMCVSNTTQNLRWRNMCGWHTCM